MLQGEQEIDDLLEEADEVIPFRYSITSYGVDYPVDSLVARVSVGDIAIPKFQRGYVWSIKEASRFIESLLLGLPVPGIFLSKEPSTQQLLVIDGQQRLLTLLNFYKGIWPVTQRVFALKGVDPQFEGLAYSQLSPDARRRLADSVIHAVVVRQDEPSQDSSSIYHIFERLNTSGVSLTPQEIRTAIYHGKFTELLDRANRTPSWRSIYGPPNRLMRDQELILRFFAFFYRSDLYRRPMKGFLNSFMADHKDPSPDVVTEMEAMFTDTINFVYQTIGKRAFKFARVLNAALFDSVMVGTARRLKMGEIKQRAVFTTNYDALLASMSFREVAERATADDESVKRRIELATEAFAQLV